MLPANRRNPAAGRLAELWRMMKDNCGRRGGTRKIRILALLPHGSGLKDLQPWHLIEMSFDL
jgi:hypothetical protein